MSNEHPEIQGIIIVLVGNLNPKIFQPAWFSANNLLGKGAADDAKINIIHEDVVSFVIEPWLKIDVTRERFIAATTQEPIDALYDIVKGTFSLLKHTPISKLGINVEMHYRYADEKSWHNFGHKVAPKDIWNEVLDKPGLRSITMEGNNNRDGIKGMIGVKISPSKRITNGVYFHINDHYEIEEPDKSVGCDEIISILERQWTKSIKRSKQMIETLRKR